MISSTKNLQHAKLYPFTRVMNTKSMTPNQSRLRASGFKGFRHIPLGPCSGFKAKASRLLFFFFFFSFSFFFFFSFLEDYISLHTWVILTYYGSSTSLRPALQGEKSHIAPQPIGTIWCAVCALAKGGMIKVEYAKSQLNKN